MIRQLDTWIMPGNAVISGDTKTLLTLGFWQKHLPERVPCPATNN
jgi:hypothetical protein